MAEQLKQQHGLTALKVSLDTYGGDRGTQARFELQGKTGAQVETLHEWKCRAEELGIPRRLDRRASLGQGPQFTVPSWLFGELKPRLHEFTRSQQPLWLHLVKPYGYLGLVPWERLLGSGLGTPILRLPDFIVPPPRETRAALDVVLCASAPVAKEPFPVVDILALMAKAILGGVSRRVVLHLFIDKDRHEELGKRVQAMGLGSDTVRLYSPESAAKYDAPEATTRVTDRSSRIDNPWLLWMRDALEGRGVDVVHFLCHGYFANDRGALALSESPVANQDARLARFVGPAELTTFLTQTGAWAACFSSPPGNFSEVGLRALADTIGQLRPGTVLHHEPVHDRSAADLRAAYGFLFNREAATPPLSGALFMYCQPYRVAGSEAEDLLESYDPWDAPMESADLAELFDREEQVPSWLAAGQRYLEQASLELKKAARVSAGRKARPAALDDSDRETLRAIQEVIMKSARMEKSGGSKS